MLSACSSAPKSPPAGEDARAPEASQGTAEETKAAEVAGPPEPYGPQPGAPKESYGPEPIQLRPLVLVFGPGLAHGFAYAGVLRALHDSKIPVGAIIGTEMGALIGTVYAMSKTINEFEWSMLKLKPDLFATKKGLTGLFGGGMRSEKIEQALKEIFGTRDLRDARLPVRIGIQRKSTGKVEFLESGSAMSAVRASLSVPGLMVPAEVEGSEASSAGAQLPFPVLEAKRLGGGPVIVVDALAAPVKLGPDEPKETSSYLASAKREAFGATKEADLVLRPNLSNVGYMDFAKRTDAVFQGRASVQAQIRQLRQWAGLPENGGLAAP